VRAFSWIPLLASAVLACAASSGAAPSPASGTSALSDTAPRPISGAERSAVELAADFALRGSEAVWERLDPEAPLRALGHDAAVLEITARLGTRAGAIWTLQTPPASYGSRVALFHLTFPSGAEDILRLEFAGPAGGKVRQLWTLVDRPQAQPGRVATARPASPAPSLAPEDVSAAPSDSAVEGLAAWMAVLVLLAWARKPARRWARFASGALLLAACSTPANDPPSGAEALVEPRLGELAPLRLALTAGDDPVRRPGTPEQSGVGGSSAPSAAARIEELWAAEAALVQGDLARVDALLGASRPSTDPPLASLLQARLAAARFRDAALAEYDAVARAGFATDFLKLEQVAVASILEEFPADTAAAALASGTREAELWYLAAAEAGSRDQFELAEARMRTAWSLRPLPRDEILAEPGLAALVARPALFPLFELGSASEPRVHAAGPREAARLPAAAEGRLCGSHYSIRLAGLEIELPGGAALAAAETPVQDAASLRGEVERRALATLSPLASGAPGAISASPARARLAEIAGRALAREGNWSELIALTGGETKAAAGESTRRLVRLRALALRQTGRTAEAKAELVRLAQSELAGRRPFPGALYDLAELVASDGSYDTAIRLVKKADAQIRRPFGEARIRQYSLSLELDRNAEELRSPHFLVRFPAGGGGRYGRQIATVLEEERTRVLQWIPQPAGEPVIVELLLLESFLDAYAGEIPVLGLFDGRVRMPLADIRSLAPEWIGLVSHELTHALLSGATRGRAPHWLQEGLAQHAEMGRLLVNPMPELEASGRTLSFPALEPILRGFAEPQLVELAYSESAWVVAFLESRGGRETLRRLVAAYAGGASTESAIQAVVGMDLPTFDRAFRDWAVRRAPAKRLIAARRFDRELERPFAAETVEAEAGRRAVDGVRVGATGSAGTPGASQRAAMVAWHELYRAATAEAKGVYSRVDRIYRSGLGAPAPADCSSLLGSATALVSGRSDALGAPELRLAKDLQAAFEALVLFGETCEQGRALEAMEHYQAAAQAFARAATQLRPFGLEP
jgi:tetratricopeptide (TPR) repeat protein